MHDTRHGRAASLGGDSAWLIAAITLMGLSLRIFYQAGRPFIGDEVGTLIHLHHSYRFLLRHFGDQWLTMNFYFIIMKGIVSLWGTGSWVMTLPSILAGTATIPLTAALARRFCSRKTALFAAFLVGANPFLCQVSVQIRAYSLQLLFGLAAFIFLVDWLKSRSWANGIGFAAAACLATLMQINTIYTCIFFAIFFLAHVRQLIPGPHVRANLAALRSIVIPGILALCVLVALYASLFDAMSTFAGKWTSARPSSVSYIAEIVGMYLGRGFFLLPSLLLLGTGVWSATQHERRLLWLGFGVLVHIIASSLAGLSLLPWVYARYLIFILPLLLIFIAEGIVHLARWWRSTACFMAAIIVAASWSIEFLQQQQAKQNSPWQEVARVLDQERDPADLVLVMKTGLINNAPLALLPYYMDRWQIFTDPKDYWAGERSSREEGRLIIVNAGRRIQSDVPGYQIGDVQILAYRGETRQDIMRHIIKDIEASTRGTISGDNTDLYDLLLTFSQGILSEEERRKYTILFYESFMRTGNMLYLLPQFQSRPELFGPVQPLPVPPSPGM